MSKRTKALSVLIVSTLAFTVCFMVWMMFGVIGIPIRKALDLNATQFGLLTATPVLTGSLIRVPLGMWTDKFGGRIVMFVLMLALRRADLAHRLCDRVLAVPRRSACSSASPADRSRSARRTSRAGSRATARASRWACTAPATRARPSTSSSPLRSSSRSAGAWCRRCTPRPCSAWRCCSGSSSYSDPAHVVERQDHLARAARRAQGSQGLEVLPVLLDRVRRLRRAVAVDGAVLRRRIRPRHPRGGAARGLLLASRRRAARRRWLVLGQGRRARADLVGAVGELDCASFSSRIRKPT